MPVKIRLQRHGRKGKPFYWIVAADSRAKRDGRFLEKLGTYNPTTNPAQIDLDLNGSVKWLRNGAQPTETARRILSYKGVMLKHHLLKGVDKGALTEAQAEEKFQNWLVEKGQKIETKKESLAKAEAEARAKALEAEKEVSEKRKATVEVAEESEEAGENAPEETAKAVPAGEAEAKEAVEEPAGEVPVEEPKTETENATTEAKVEEPKAEEAADDKEAGA